MSATEHHSSLKDITLWNELVAGREKALEELMRIYYKSLLNYGYKFLKDEEFLKDCLQDVFIEIWNRKTQIAQPSNVKAYLLVSLRRRIFRNGRRQHLFENKVSSLDENEAGIEFSPEWWLIEEESLALRTRRMTDLLNALPARQREVIYLKYYQDLGREEISEMLSITPQTVSNILQIAYSFLRKHWNPTAIGVILKLVFD